MATHDDLLNEYVNVSLFPYSELAKRQGVFFPPSHRTVGPIHAPYWQDNVVAPGFAFWMQTGVPKYDASMIRVYGEVAAHTTLERHDWLSCRQVDAQARRPRGLYVVAICNDQFKEMGEAYNDTFTYAVAALADTCALIAISTFYRFDEVISLGTTEVSLTHATRHHTPIFRATQKTKLGYSAIRCCNKVTRYFTKKLQLMRRS